MNGGLVPEWAPLAERIQAQQAQIEFLSALSTRLIHDGDILKVKLAEKEGDLLEADRHHREQQARDKRLCFHIQRTEALHKRPNFFNPTKGV